MNTNTCQEHPGYFEKKPKYDKEKYLKKILTRYLEEIVDQQDILYLSEISKITEGTDEEIQEEYDNLFS